MPRKMKKSALDALAGGWHSDPFSLLGLHREGEVRVVRTLQPQATTVSLVSVKGTPDQFDSFTDFNVIKCQHIYSIMVIF